MIYPSTKTAKIKVSILVPIYGTEKYIKKCAETLFDQSYENIEYIFVNDCTKDDSMSILEGIIKNYPQREKQIKIIHHKTNQGLAAARLTGLNNSTGDYIWFVDSDDYVECNAVEACIKWMSCGYDLIVFNYFNENSSSARKSKIKKIDVKSVLKHDVSPMIWKCLIRRELFFSHDIFPVKGINFSEDLLLLSRLVLVSTNTIVLNDCLYHYNCTNVSSYTANIKIEYIENSANAIMIICDFYKRLEKDGKYSHGLCFLLIEVYIKLYKSDPKNKKLLELKTYIKRFPGIGLFVFYLTVIFKTNVFIKILRRL